MKATTPQPAAAAASAQSALPDDDPLMLNGCRIRIEWPHGNETRVREGVLEYKPMPGKQRRYEFMKEKAGLVRIKKTNWKHLKKRKYEVLASPRKAKHFWTKAEEEAAQRRRAAPVPEEYKSISVSLGRPYCSVQIKLAKLNDPAYAPATGGGTGSGARVRVGWRDRVRRAMEQLPGRRGTLHDVCAQVEKLGVPLDRSVAPGFKSMQAWQKTTSRTLARYPEFAQTGERAANPAVAQQGARAKKTLAVWQYLPPAEGAPAPPSAKQLRHMLHGPRQPSQATATKKQLNLVKAFRK